MQERPRACYARNAWRASPILRKPDPDPAAITVDLTHKDRDRSCSAGNSTRSANAKGLLDFEKSSGAADVRITGGRCLHRLERDQPLQVSGDAQGQPHRQPHDGVRDRDPWIGARDGSVRLDLTATVPPRAAIVGYSPTVPISRSREATRSPWRPWSICEDVWLPWHAFILPGARIGRGSIVGAFSLVGGEVPEYTRRPGAGRQGRPDLPAEVQRRRHGGTFGEYHAERRGRRGRRLPPRQPVLTLREGTQVVRVVLLPQAADRLAVDLLKFRRPRSSRREWTSHPPPDATGATSSPSVRHCPCPCPGWWTRSSPTSPATGSGWPGTWRGRCVLPRQHPEIVRGFPRPPVKDALEAAGVVFIGDPIGSPGVQLVTKAQSTKSRKRASGSTGGRSG